MELYTEIKYALHAFFVMSSALLRCAPALSRAGRAVQIGRVVQTRARSFKISSRW